MKRSDLLRHLAERILVIHKKSPILVAIDGVDAAGKTMLADELALESAKSGRDIIRASIDGFHNAEEIRYVRGIDSPEGYYRDSFNYPELKAALLNPLKGGAGTYHLAVFDYRTNLIVEDPLRRASSSSILLMDGVFLLRPELREYWDLSIFLHADFDETLKRAIRRSGHQPDIAFEQVIIEKYNKRYIPGHQLYFDEAQPKKHANIVVENSDFENPVIQK